MWPFTQFLIDEIELTLAVLVPVDPVLNAADVLSVCSRKLPSFKVPQDVCFVPDLPKSASGKVDKQRCETLIKVL